MCLILVRVRFCCLASSPSQARRQTQANAGTRRHTQVYAGIRKHTQALAALMPAHLHPKQHFHMCTQSIIASTRRHTQAQAGIPKHSQAITARHLHSSPLHSPFPFLSPLLLSPPPPLLTLQFTYLHPHHFTSLQYSHNKIDPKN